MKFSGSKMRTIREERGIRPEALAVGIGRAMNTIGNWERGDSTPNADDLAALAEFFKVTLDAFYERAA